MAIPGVIPSPIPALAQLLSVYSLPGPQPGMAKAGNINLFRRPQVRNPDGSVSTVRSITVGVGPYQMLLPTVVGHAVVSPHQAIAHYLATGQNLGAFRTNAAAEKYAQALHQQQARLYTR